MNRIKSPINRFKRIAIPVFNGMVSIPAKNLANALDGMVHLICIVEEPRQEDMSAAALKASQLREKILDENPDFSYQPQISVRFTNNKLDEINKVVQEEKPDLVIFEWPHHFDAFQKLPIDVLDWNICDIAVIRGNIPKTIKSIFLPVRGGPYAELALKMGSQLPHEELLVVNFARESTEKIDQEFVGLSRILPGLKDVTYKRYVEVDIFEGIIKASKNAQLILMGASGKPRFDQGQVGTVFEEVLMNADLPVIAVKTCNEVQEAWKEDIRELYGARAISLLVDRWFAENTYRAREFENLEKMVEMKKSQGLTISLALPALNEEKTVGNVISTIKKTLYDEFPLLDEIVLVDSDSTDSTREIAADLGVPVFIHQQILPDMGTRAGKGEALWKSLYVTSGDILVWIDTDILNIDPRFVYGVIGPMLINPNIEFVKGFYRRPLKVGDKIQAGGGGRVTELTARPMLNLFYPELSGVIQPLSGEYGGRRSALEKLHFFSGYGVEIGLLIEMVEKFGISSIGQVDLLERIHRNQSLEALSKMSFVIIQAVLRRLEDKFNLQMLEDVNRTIKLIRYQRGQYFLDIEEKPEFERPPMIDVPRYQEKMKEIKKVL